ncbi:MAG: hypothetical protein HQK49_19670 [Oligoflexia bacterium]|nr:hypothetical protein [Oligoflexia bacterium]
MLIEANNNYWTSTFRNKNRSTTAYIIDAITQALTKKSCICVVGGAEYVINNKVAYSVLKSVLHTRNSTLLINYTDHEINITDSGLELNTDHDVWMFKENFNSDTAYTKLSLETLETALSNLKTQCGLRVIVINSLMGFLKTNVGYDYEKHEDKIKEVLSALKNLLQKYKMSAIIISNFSYSPGWWDNFQFFDVPYSHILQSIIDYGLFTYRVVHVPFGENYPRFASPLAYNLVLYRDSWMPLWGAFEIDSKKTKVDNTFFL